MKFCEEGHSGFMHFQERLYLYCANLSATLPCILSLPDDNPLGFTQSLTQCQAHSLPSFRVSSQSVHGSSEETSRGKQGRAGTGPRWQLGEDVGEGRLVTIGQLDRVKRDREKGSLRTTMTVDIEVTVLS